MQASLRDGTSVVVREIRPGDKAALAAGHERLSPGSRQRRYLTAKPRLTASELRYLTEVDGCDHVALTASPAGSPERIVAVARFVRDREDRELAEFAIVVEDAYQRRGLGTVLARALAREARARGIARLKAVTLADNVAARRLIATIARDLRAELTGGGATELSGRLAA